MALKTAYCLIFLLAFGFSNAQILIADNNAVRPTGANVYSTLQAAIDAAQDDDTIYVQPSPNNYGTITVNKRISIIGGGFNQPKDNPQQSVLNTISTQTGPLSSASGSKFIGLNFSRLNLATDNLPLSDILVANCYVRDMIYQALGWGVVDRLTIYLCFFPRSGDMSALQIERGFNEMSLINCVLDNGEDIEYSGTGTGTHFFYNNIFMGPIWLQASGTNSMFYNNAFISDGSRSAFYNRLVNCFFYNNVFYGMTPSIAVAGTVSGSFASNTFENNITFNCQDNTLPPQGSNSGSGNFPNVDPELTAISLNTNWLTNYDFTPIAGGASEGTGNSGEDLGVFGGVYSIPNYIFQPVDGLPIIQTFTAQPIINPGDDLPVRVRSTGN